MRSTIIGKMPENHYDAHVRARERHYDYKPIQHGPHHSNSTAEIPGFSHCQQGNAWNSHSSPLGLDSDLSDSKRITTTYNNSGSFPLPLRSSHITAPHDYDHDHKYVVATHGYMPLVNTMDSYQPHNQHLPSMTNQGFQYDSGQYGGPTMQHDDTQRYQSDDYYRPPTDSLFDYAPASSAYHHNDAAIDNSFQHPNNMLAPYFSQHSNPMQSYPAPTLDMAVAFALADDSHNMPPNHNIQMENPHGHSLRSMNAAHLPLLLEQDHRAPQSRQKSGKTTEPITLPGTDIIVLAGPSSKGTRPIDALPFPTTRYGDYKLMCGNDHILPELNVSCVKNMQIMEHEPKLVCYRRNYMTVSCSYKLPIPAHRQADYPSGFKDKTFEVLDKHGQRWVVKALGVKMIGTIDGFQGKEISLVRYDPARDAGKKYKIYAVPCLPDQSDTPQYNHHSMTSSMPNLPFQAVNRDEPLSTNHVFERVQFRQATSNNGQRRASQQFFHLEIQVVADVAPVVNTAGIEHRHAGHWMVVQSLMSSGLVVRGRSPSHYMKSPIDLHLLTEQPRKSNKKKKRAVVKKHLNEDGELVDEETEDGDEAALANEEWAVDPRDGREYVSCPSGAKKIAKKQEADRRAAAGLPPLSPKPKGGKKGNAKKNNKRPQKSTATDKNTAKKDTARSRAAHQVSEQHSSYPQPLDDYNTAARLNHGAAVAPMMPLDDAHGTDLSTFINYEPNMFEHDSSITSGPTESPESEYAQLDESHNNFLNQFEFPEGNMKLIDDETMIPVIEPSYLRTHIKPVQAGPAEDYYHDAPSSMNW